MKKTNLYYLTMYGRTNVLKGIILGFFFGISSWPRLLLEVFIRKSFGERYFSFSTSIRLFLVCCSYPFIREYSIGFWSTVGHNASWFIFMFGFLYFAWKRRGEVKREPGVFDFAKFSLSGGITHPKLRDIKINGEPLTRRTVSIWIEPGLFFVTGILLILCRQSVGILITVCSIIYSLSYVAAYTMGDDFIMDTIDKMICNEELAESFVHNRPVEQTKGFEPFIGQRPVDEDFRQRVNDNFFEGEEETARAF